VWRITLKGLLAHRVRLVLTTLSVVLGVAFVSGTFVLTDTMSAVFEDLVQTSSSSVDVVVRGASPDTGSALEELDTQPPTLRETLLDDVLAVPGVASAEGTVEGYAMLVRPNGDAITPSGPPTLGAAWSDEGLRVVAEGGRPPTEPDEVVIDEATAERYDLPVGERITIVFSATPPREFTIVGIAAAEEGDNLAGATYAEFDRRTAQEVLDLQGQYTGFSVWAHDYVTPEALVTRLETSLPADVDAITAEDRADEIMEGIDQALGFITIIFGIFAGIAVVVGAFIIANTFSITVLQRTREFALLRSLGASRRQVVASVVGEAAVIGLLASVLGILAGLGLAVGLNELLRVMGFDMPSGSLVLQPRTIVVALAIGLVVTIVSSLLPARRAAGIHPMAAMRAVSIQAYRPSRLRLVSGIAAGIGATVAVAIAIVAQPDSAGLLVGLGAILALAALGATGPALTRPVLRLFGGSGQRFGTVGRIARSNSLRTPRRTWTTAAALTIGVALVSAVAVMASSIKASSSDALEGTLRADVVLSAGNAMTGGTVPPVLARSLEAVPIVSAVAPIPIGGGEIDGSHATISAIDPVHWDAVAETTFVEGDLTGFAPQMTIAVDRELAEREGYAVGDVLPAIFPASGETELRLKAIFEPDQLLSGWLVSIGTHEALFNQVADASVLVAGDEGAAPEEVLAAVEQAASSYPAVVVQDQAQYRDSVAGQVDRILALVTALLAMAVFIAVLGIMNTLALSIHERTHEIGLLRAVGMTRGQVRGMIRWEAVTIAWLGAFVGLLLGVVFGWATTRALSDQGMTAFVIPWVQLAGAVLIAVVAGVLAAILPARRAAKLDVLRAVTVE
jgi:putative ABC transport system permease protein